MRERAFGKRILAVFFIAWIAVFMINGSPLKEIGVIARYLAGEVSQEEPVTIDQLGKDYTDHVLGHQAYIDLNGKVSMALGVQGYYGRQGIYITDDRYIVSPAEKTSTDYEYEQIVSLKKFLDERGIYLLYVNEPVKYVDDAFFSDTFGIESYSNRNADLFLERIADAGIHAIDLRQKMDEDGLSAKEMFYRTDHHWTTRSGLWATEKIAEGLNEYCGYEIDTSIYDESNYSFTEWKECWLGEQGRKVSASYVGMDDYTLIKPKFATDYTFKTNRKMVDGTFDQFINENIYKIAEGSEASTASWHYFYRQRDVINHHVDYGKVLLLGDSYAQVTEPFLSLGVSEINYLILREFSGDLRQYIEEGDYDTVLICYAQFMIGAHDNPESANYKMFQFE